MGVLKRESGIYQGIERTWSVYIPDHYVKEVGKPLIFLLADQDDQYCDIWCKLAEKYDFILVIPNLISENDDEKIILQEIVFLKELYGTVTNWWKDGYAILGAERYMFATEKYRKTAAQWTASMPQYFAAASLIGTDTISENWYYQSILPVQKFIPIGLWLIADQPVNEEELAFWKGICRSEETSEKAAYNGILCEQYKNPFNPAAQIVLSGGEKQYSKEKLSDTVLKELFLKNRRWVNYKNGGTLYRKREIEAIEKTIQVGAVQRSFHVFIPKEKPGAAYRYPVVLSFHGITANGKYFMEQTRWDLVAEKYKFIAVCPTALNGVWKLGENQGREEIQFVHGLLQWIESVTNIDRERIYCTGFSLGASLTDYLMIHEPDLFAAGAAICGQQFEGASCHVLRKDTHISEKCYRTMPIPPVSMWQLRGEHEAVTEFPGDPVKSSKFWREVACVQDRVPIKDERDIGYETYVYPGEFAEYRQTNVIGVGHGILSNCAKILWMDFLSKYSRPSVNADEVRAEVMGDKVGLRWRNPKHESFKGTFIIIYKGDACERIYLDAEAEEKWIERPEREKKYTIRIWSVFSCGTSKNPVELEVL